MISLRTSQIRESATLASAQKAREFIELGKPVIQLTIGEPDVPTPRHIKEAVCAAILSDQADKYTAATGLFAVKEAIVKFHAKYDGVSYEPNQVVVGTGAKHILYVLFQAILNPGDKVIVPTPYWVSYSEQIKLAQGEPIFVETTKEQQFKLTLAQLEALDITGVKALIINSPNNPTGAVYTADELQRIGEWAVKHNLLIISDEIYYRLVYGDAESVCMASLSSEIKQQVIVINGVAKAYAMTGWRVGYAMSQREDVLTAMAQLISHETGNLTVASQYAAVAAYSQSQQSVEDMVNLFQERLELFYPLICQIEGFELEKPQGAFYLFPDVTKAMALTGYCTVSEFATALLEEAYVAVVPGDAFGSKTCIRMSYAGDTAELIEAARRIREFVEKKTIRG